MKSLVTVSVPRLDGFSLGTFRMSEEENYLISDEEEGNYCSFQSGSTF